MMRFSINEHTTWRWSFDEDVARYAAEGVRTLGVSRHKLNDFGEQAGIRLLRDSGFEVSNLLFVGGFTGCDGRSLAESVADAAGAIQLCTQLKTSCLVVYTGGRSLHTHSHARRLVKDALVQLLPLAEEHGVTLAVEPMRADCSADCTFLHTVSETLSLLDSIGSPYVKLAFNTYHQGFDDATLSTIHEWASRTAIVHLGDGRRPRGGEQVRRILGEGDVPLDRLVRGLLSVGYDGYFDLELTGIDLESTDYASVIRRSKQWCDNLASVSGAA